jgi:CRISPR-associated protein Csm1
MLSLRRNAWMPAIFCRWVPGKNPVWLLPALDGLEDELELLRQLAVGHGQAERYGIYYLAQAYGSRVGIGGGGHPEDVALFDRNRLLAAVTQCLHHPGYDGEFLFVKGAVSGIQRFIYHQIQAEQTGEAENVSKRLRGRSFFVAILADILADYLVEQLGLEQANILFVGGGHFNLLLPKTAEIESELDGLIHRINTALLDQFRLHLGLVHGVAPFKKKELQDFQEVLALAHYKLESQKQRRFKGYLAQSVFSLTIPDRIPGSGLLEDLGEAVPHAHFLVEVSGDEAAREKFKALIPKGGKHPLHLKAVGKDYYLVIAEKQEEEAAWQGLHEWWEEALSIIEPSGLSLKLTRLNSARFLPPAQFAAHYHALPISYGFRYVGQHTPRYDKAKKEAGKEAGKLMWFEDIAEIGHDGEVLTYPQLAALRLDVDDLGALFQCGLGERASLARTLVLSREMQLFFGGHLNQIAARNGTYVVYAGGDDAFVISSWQNALYFIHELRQDFDRLTGSNQHVGLSAGIFTCHPKYPVARLGYDAGEQEEGAKNRLVGKVKVKDGLRVFEHTLSWDRFGAMMEYAEALCVHVENKKGKGEIKRSLLQHFLLVIQAAHAAREAEERAKVLALERQAEGAASQAAEEPDHFEFYRNLGRLHALIKRRGYSGKEGDTSKPAGLIDQLLKDTNQFELFADYILPLQFALYKTRS